MIELLLLAAGAIIAVGVLWLNEVIAQGKHAGRVGMPASGSAVIQSTRRLEDPGTVTHIEIIGEWGEPEGYDGR